MSRKNSKNTLGDLNEFLKAQQNGKEADGQQEHSTEQFVEQQPNTLVVVDRFNEEREVEQQPNTLVVVDGFNEEKKVEQQPDTLVVVDRFNEEKKVEQQPNTLVVVDHFNEEREKVLSSKAASRDLSEQLLETARERNVNWMSLWMEVFAQASTRQATRFTHDVLNFQFAMMENYVKSSAKIWGAYDPSAYAKMWQSFLPKQ